LQAKLELNRVEPIMELNYNGWLLALHENIRLRWEWLKLANTLAYYDMAKIIAVKHFIV
jgi:hypothetical protein